MCSQFLYDYEYVQHWGGKPQKLAALMTSMKKTCTGMLEIICNVLLRPHKFYLTSSVIYVKQFQLAWRKLPPNIIQTWWNRNTSQMLWRNDLFSQPSKNATWQYRGHYYWENSKKKKVTDCKEGVENNVVGNH